MKVWITALIVTISSTCWAQTWSEITVNGAAPSARRYAGTCYDPVGHRMIVFGGQSASGRLNDLWAFDLATDAWVDLTPATGPTPQTRRTPNLIYDPAGARLVMWSGQDGGTFFDDIWSFDLALGQWTELTPPAPIPNRRYGTATIYDPVAGGLVAFAGFTFQGRFDDTWRFDLATGTWTDVSPAMGPIERCLHSASYDSREHRMILYGGQNAGGLDDTWAFDLTDHTWEELTPAIRPTGRFFTAHVYDARHHRAVIFGGTQGAAGNTDEVWLFNLHNDQWIPLTPAGPSPSAREGSSAIYVETEDRMVVFGGHDGSYRNDVWSLGGLSATTTSTGPELSSVLRSLEAAPNPFNPRTTIRFELDRPARVVLRVHDVAGRVVGEIERGHRTAGAHRVTWSGTDQGGTPLSSGVYFARIDADGEVLTRKLVLVR